VSRDFRKLHTIIPSCEISSHFTQEDEEKGEMQREEDPCGKKRGLGNQEDWV